MESSVDPKPPNVLLYSGCGENAYENFQTFADVVRQLIDCSDRYTLYPLSYRDIVQSVPWADNTAALMINCGIDEMDEGVQKAFVDFVKSGGRLLAFGPSVASIIQEFAELSGSAQQLVVIDKELKAMKIREKPAVDKIGGEFKTLVNCFQDSSEFGSPNMTVIADCCDTDCTYPVIVKVECNTGSAILSLARLDLTPTDVQVRDKQVFDELKFANESRCNLFTNLLKMLGLNVSPLSTITSPSRGFLACTEMVAIFVLLPVSVGSNSIFVFMQCQKALTRALQPVVKDGLFQGRKVSMRFLESDLSEYIPSDSELPIVFGRGVPEGHGFDWHTYSRALKTRVLGRALLYTQVIRSTQTLLDR